MIRRCRSECRNSACRAHRRRVAGSLCFEPLEPRLLLATLEAWTTAADGGPGSLRDAVRVANSNNQDDVIVLTEGTYRLTLAGQAEDGNARGDLDVTSPSNSLHILGVGAGRTIIDAAAVDRVFDIHPQARLILSNLTLTGGDVLGSGGAIRNRDGHLELNRVEVQGNQASEYGGGIQVLRVQSWLRPSAKLRESQVTNNQAGASGGGIFNDNADLTVIGSLLSENSAAFSGGGINNHGAVTIDGSELSRNQASSGGGFFNMWADDVSITASKIVANQASGYGGGIANGGSAAGASTSAFTITNTQLVRNQASRGGGIDNDNGSFSLYSSTVAENVAGGFATAWDGHGGGIWNSNGAVVVENSTVSSNQATRGGGLRNAYGSDVRIAGSTFAANTAGIGGGIHSDSGAPIVVVNTILASNTATTSAPDVLGNFTSRGHNLVGFSNAVGFLPGLSGDLVGTPDVPIDALLGPLRDNGGPTATHALLTGSPAIDAGDNASASATDQRGVLRPQNGTVDIGAYEFPADNNAPIARDDGPYWVSPGQGLSVSPERGVLINDLDPDADPLDLRVVTGTSHGLLDLRQDGSFTYTHGGRDQDTDQFTYEISDPDGTAARAVVTILIGNPATALASAAGSLEYLRRVMDQYHETYGVYEDVSSAGNHFHAWSEIRHAPIIDNTSTGFSRTGTWTASPAVDAYGSGSLWTTQTGATAKFQTPVEAHDTYEIWAWWGGTDALNNPLLLDGAAKFVIRSSGGPLEYIVDQNQGRGQWNLIATVELSELSDPNDNAEPLVKIVRESAGGGPTVADAIRIAPPTGDVTVTGSWSEAPFRGATSIRAELINEPGVADAGGFYHLVGLLEDRSPTANFGEVDNAGIDLTGATELTFWARGETGGEKVDFFVAGVGRDPSTGVPTQLHPDSSPRIPSPGTLTELTAEWRQYRIDLRGADLSYVLGGFGWYAKDALNPSGAVFYLDDIQFEFSEPARQARLELPRFLRSYTTLDVQPIVGGPEPDVDFVLRNLAFSYDNSLALLAFLADPDPATQGDSLRRAGLIGDAFVYAAENDRTYTDGRIRTAYSAGDIALPPGWKANGRDGTVPIPGFYQEQRIEDGHVVGEFFEVEQEAVDTGNNAWVMLALLQLYKRTGDTPYLEAARNIGQFVQSFKNDVGTYQGFLGGLAQPESDSPAPRIYASTEHNIDVFAVFSTMYELTGDEQWRTGAEHARAFVEAMWCSSDDSEPACHDPELNEVFLTGTKNPQERNLDQFPLDPQSWSGLSLPNVFANFPPVLEHAVRSQGVEEQDYLGFDFNADRDGIWFEGTAQMATAFAAMDDPGWAEFYRRQVQRVQYDPVLHPPVNSPYVSAGGIPAAYHDLLSTGFGFELFRRDHVAVAAWNVFAQSAHNPFYSQPALNPPALTLVLNDTVIREGRTTTAVVSRADAVGQLRVLLVSSDNTELTVPPVITLADGHFQSEPFVVTAHEDGAADGTQSVTLFASASSHLTARENVEVLDRSPWQNPVEPCDVDDDGHVAPLDVLLVINFINQQPNVYELPPVRPPGAPFYDVDGNGIVSAADALMVINAINTGASGGEGESGRPKYDPIALLVPRPSVSGVTAATIVQLAMDTKPGEADQNHRKRRADEREPAVWHLPASVRDGGRLDGRSQRLSGLPKVTTDLPLDAEVLLDEFVEDVHRVWRRQTRNH